MKTRLIFATLLLLAFGTARAQDTITVVKRGADAKKADTLRVITPNMSELPELMQELGVYLQMLTDSVDWKSFEKDMEKWGEDMEKWGRKMEQWGEEFEKKYGEPNGYQPLKGSDTEVRTIQVKGSGDVRIHQNQSQFSVIVEGVRTSNYVVEDGTLLVSGPNDWDVTMKQLETIVMRSSGDVYGMGTLKGGNLDIKVYGSGDLRMDVDYDTIRVQMFGSGDVTLKGRCNVLYADLTGSGDLKAQQLSVVESRVNATGSGKAWTNKSGNVVYQEYRREKSSAKRGLLFNPSWNGFEAGLNMLFNTPFDVVNTNNGAQGMELRPLRSWYFGFNLADVGIAFDRRHTAGLFTGVGIGWHNFSWNNDITVEYDPDHVVNTLVPIDADQVVKTSKYGALFLEVPLMVEVRPVRCMYIDAGVTGGLRFAQWNRVKLADGSQHKHYYSSANLNLFKLDASIRVGYDFLGFFANYSLLPIFKFPDSTVHPFTFGFSLSF